MTKNQILESKLGFNRVREIIAGKCSTQYAANRTEEEEFCTTASEIRRRLLLTDEMRLILMFEDKFPTVGYIDCLDFLIPLEAEGACIDLHSLGKLRTMLETLRKIGNFFASVKDSVYPNLTRLAGGRSSFPEIAEKTDRILDRYGSVKDTASEELYEIRRDLKSMEGEISRRAGAILRAAKAQGIVEADASIAVHDGKMLIPVPAANKRKMTGFVFDESATGKTVFIQPQEIIDLENDIVGLKHAESREIARILAQFSDFARPWVPELKEAAALVGELDFIMAKAQAALDFIAGMPVISDEGATILRKARHPLLEKALAKEGRKIVPLTATLTRDKHILLISGPNAGGKSVCLKTFGLLQYMFQWGMLIPSSETSEMMVFDRIMVDIGDGQSIDNDLSTYSAFLDSMKRMLGTADDRTLVLIDEFGSGTEPAAGGAIAEAILSELDSRGVYGVITTHYTNLKLYASRSDCGVINGAMQFNAKDIEPLFVLETGLPGNSFAFELARKMGLPEAIVKDAESRAGEGYVGLERNLRKIARSRRVINERLERIKHADKTMEGLTDRYEKELEEIKGLRKEILDQARQEAEKMVKDAGSRIERTIREIKESEAEKDRTKAARGDLQLFLTSLAEGKKERENYLDDKLRQVKERREKQKTRRVRRGEESPVEEAAAQDKVRSGPLKVGEKARILDNGMVGEIAKVSPSSVTLIIGSVSTKIPVSRVVRISNNEYKNEIRPAAKPMQAVDPVIRERRLNFKTELDVRGERLADALEQVTRFVDDAIMLGMGQVRIIHGKGTGVLHEEIQKLLKTATGVQSVTDEDIRHGGSGVTIVTLY